VRCATLRVGLLAAAFAGSWVAGCGSSSDNAGDDAGGSSSGSGDDSGGSPDAGYPAFTPEMPVLQNAKGATLTAPKIVTVTWPSDTNQASLQDFDDRVGASSYWKSALAEYGIGPASSGSSNHVVVQTPPPATWAAADIDKWAQQQAGNPSTSGWPAPDAQTVYMVFIPSNINVTDVDPTNKTVDACTLEEGYHTTLTAGSNPNGVAYALALEHCSIEYGTDVLGDATETAAHELAEAATDPFSDAAGNSSGWAGFDKAHLGWELWNQWQDEVADACQFFDEAYYKEGADLPYMVQRLWSNASAMAGHDPCVPLPAAPYNNVSPLGLEDVSVTAVDANGKVSPLPTKGWHIAPGQTAKVQVGFYSDAPTAAWSVQAIEGDCCTQPWTNVLTVSPSTFTGQNGDTVELSITANKAPAQGTAALLTFWSSAGNKQNHYMPVVVGVY
jgi:hypothetical protein